MFYTKRTREKIIKNFLKKSSVTLSVDVEICNEVLDRCKDAQDYYETLMAERLASEIIKQHVRLKRIRGRTSDSTIFRASVTFLKPPTCFTTVYNESQNIVREVLKETK